MMTRTDRTAYVQAFLRLSDKEYMVVQHDNIEILNLEPYKSFDFDVVDEYDGEVLLKRYEAIKNLVIK